MKFGLGEVRSMWERGRLRVKVKIEIKILECIIRDNAKIEFSKRIPCNSLLYEASF